MHKKKRGQVTVYIIIGIAILFVAILFFYLRGTTEKKISVQELVIAQKIPKEARPITNYVTTNLDDATKKGLLLIGMQGGYIYESQGGPISDPIKEGSDFVYYNKHKIFYNIHKQNNNLFNYYFYKPPYYPWYYYPYSHLPKSGEKGSFGGFFGTSNLPPLNGSSPSIQFQLMEFITNYLQEKINLTIFDEQGFEIDADINNINVSVIIGENDVIAFLECPLGIKKTITNTITNVSYFYTNPQIRLKKVYNLTNFIISKDTTDILFNINSSENNKDNINIEKIENYYNHDDIIIIRDNKSMLYAEPYTFQFARENRYPALHYLDIPMLPFEGYSNAVITEDNINPEADDPDEDVIDFTYEPNLPYHITQSDFDVGYVDLIVYAKEKDNEDYSDWQELKINVTRESEY